MLSLREKKLKLEKKSRADINLSKINRKIPEASYLLRELLEFSLNSVYFFPNIHELDAHR